MFQLFNTKNDDVTLPTLYHTSKAGKISEWTISVQEIDDIPNVVTVYGYSDGAKQTTAVKVRSGKNIGRSNQTTAWEQAIADANSKWEKKRLENYRTDKDEEAVTILPMLAHKYLDHKEKLKLPCYIQPKLNGARCLAHITENGVSYFSRKSKRYETLHHWDTELQNLFPCGTIVDGEVFHPQLNFQEIIRRVKRVKASRQDILDQELQFWIYDTIQDGNFDKRNEWLKFKLSKGLHPNLVHCQTVLIEDIQSLERWHQYFLQMGFEGSMLRNLHGAYRPDYRSYDLLKYKQFMDAEFKIVGGRSAQGKDEGTVIFECETATGQVFAVRPKGTWEERQYFLDQLDNCVGKFLTVRYQEMSEDGIPIFPVGLCVRDFE